MTRIASKNNIKKMFLILVSLFLILVIYGSLQYTLAAEKEEATIRLGCIVSEKHSVYKVAQKFAQLVDNKTNGKVKVNLYFGGALGTSPGMIKGIQMGTLEMLLDWTNVWGPFIPAMNVTSLPFLFKSPEDIANFYSGEPGKILEKLMLEKTNVEHLAWLDYGYHHLFSTIPVKSIDDVKTLNIRCPPAPVIVEQYKLLGANPVVVPFPEVYTSLASGVLNAIDVSFSGFLGSKLYEVCKYGVVTRQIQLEMFLCIGNNFFKNLSSENQKAIVEAAMDTKRWHDKQVWEVEAEEHDKISKLITLTKPDLEPFYKATEAMYGKYTKMSEENRALINAARGMTK